MMQDPDLQAARAALLWQIELGADEAIGEMPVDRYAEAEAARPRAGATVAAGEAVPRPLPMETAAAGQAAGLAGDHAVEAVAEAVRCAEAAADLEALRAAMDAYAHCALKRGARSLVFADGAPAAPVMIVGEAPGRDEDIAGRPFVGRAGQLLDRMFGAIGMGRAHPDPGRALYIANVLPWRPPENRDPAPEEIAMMLPFLRRHVELAAPEVLVLMGNHACMALLGRQGITRMRGQWTEALGRPALPMFHPAYLLRNPAAKREAWHDLLMLQARLRAGG